MITNRDCFFNKKSDFVNRLTELSPNSVVYIADTQQIWTQNKYFECAMTSDKVEELIEAHGYLTSDDIPNLTGGATASTGQFVNKVTGDGHKLVVGLGNFSGVTVGKANQLATARTITLSGDVSGSASFNGASNITINTTVADNSHEHTLSNISDLNTTWAGLLDSAPSAYVTRWPTINEVTGKQNLVIKLNGGTTEGTNMFTFNGVTSKSINITPGTIGAQVAGNYMTTDTAQNITGAKTSIGKPWSVRMNRDSDNAVAGLMWKNTSGSNIAGLTYHNTLKRIFINANYLEVTDVWNDAVGKYSLRIGWNELTYNNYPILRSDTIDSYALTPSNYTSTLDGRYVKKTGDTITGNLKLSDSNILIPESASATSFAGILDTTGTKAILAYFEDDTYCGLNTGTHYIRSGNTHLIHRKGSSDYTIFDSSNYTNWVYTKSQIDSSLNKYLPLAGGTMTGALTLGDSSRLNLVVGGTTRTAVYDDGDYTIFGDPDYKACVRGSRIIFQNAIGGNGLVMEGDTFTFKGNSIWHAGNDGSGSGLDADLLDGKQGEWYQNNGLKFNRTAGTSTAGGYDANALIGKGGIMVNMSSSAHWTNTPADLQVGSIFHIEASNYASGAAQFAWDTIANSTTVPTKTLWFRAANNIGFANDWHQIAFTDGNVASATKLQTARTINGTSFNGTANITTANWGTARSIGIVNSDGTGTAVTTSVNGSANVNLKLPATIKASLTGNASTATKLATARTITIGNTSKSFDGSANVSWSLSEIGAASSGHTHTTSASSNATTNLSITAGGTTATIADLYATYADSAGSVAWNNVTSKPSTFTPSSHTHTATQISGLTASRALISNSSGQPAVSAITSTELGYLDGVTSNIQTQLNGKAASSHTHTISQISNLASSWDDVLINQGVRSRSITFNGTNYPCYTAAANTSAVTWYAPTTAGTSGYILQSTGGAPKWISRATLQHELFTAGVGCTAIPANANLNDYQTPGNYYCAANATVETMSNTPSDYAFNLEVRAAAGVIQIFREYGYNSYRRDFIRGYYNGTWTAWKELAVTSDIPSLSGYATQSWVNSQSFAKTSDIPSLDGYATQSWVSDNFQVPITLNSTTAALKITKIGADTFNFSMTTEGLGNLIDISGTSTTAQNLRLNINGTVLTINDLIATRIGNYAITVVDSLPTVLVANTIYFVY